LLPGGTYVPAEKGTGSGGLGIPFPGLNGGSTVWNTPEERAKLEAAGVKVVEGLGFGPGFKGTMITKVNDKVAITHSPLVLDLQGDGILPTSVKTGVSFDLMGLGALKTAWVKGDDALLVLDRNGNGRIDSGFELFGASTRVAGVPADNGFKALAELDRAVNGGNGNGRIDAGDKMFVDLQVWKDANSDGVSQREELSSLDQVGVKAIDLAYQNTVKMDSFGNDLSLQGTFTRKDGSKGQLIDVFFVVTAE
jgi:hypothetical protein